MRIGFDGRYAQGDLVGVGKYIKSLVFGLAKKGVDCTLFYSEVPKEKLIDKNIKSVVLKTKSPYIFEQVLLPRALNKYKIDIFHATGNVGVPVSSPVPSVLTIHDIIPLEVKDYFSSSIRSVLSKASYKFRLKTSINKAQKIVCVSNYVKNSLVNNLNAPANKIVSIHSGPPNISKPGNLPKALIGKKYILNHGGIDKRKNLDRLIIAFDKVRKNNPELFLVITGKNHGLKLPFAKNIIYTGYVDDETLWAIIKNSQMVCYTSLSEGFGFPVLEGFALGVPVVTSNTSSLPEIAGEAALLVDPTSSKEIANAIQKVLTDKKLVNSMVLKGKTQYNKFSWQKAINEYLNLYNSI